MISDGKSSVVEFPIVSSSHDNFDANFLVVDGVRALATESVGGAIRQEINDKLFEVKAKLVEAARLSFDLNRIDITQECLV